MATGMPMTFSTGGFRRIGQRTTGFALRAPDQDVVFAPASQLPALDEFGDETADHRARAGYHLREVFMRELGDNQNSPRVPCTEPGRQVFEHPFKPLAKGKAQKPCTMGKYLRPGR